MFLMQEGGDEGAAETTTSPLDKFDWSSFDFQSSESWQELGTYALFELGPPLLQALLIWIIGRMILRIAVGIVRKILGKKGVDETLTGFLANILNMAGMALIIVSVIGAIGVETAQFAAILGAAVFAIGFALQGSLSNFAAGVMLIFFRPFKVGDFVEAGGTSGVIVEITVFSTILKTGDNKKVIVPNAGMTGGNIVNYSANDTRRVDLVFGIGYDDDMDKAKEIMRDVMSKDDRILAEPAPVIGLVELADSSVNFVCRPWCTTADYWGVLFDLNENMKKAFDANGINIPYPQQDVHMHEVKSA